MPYLNWIESSIQVSASTISQLKTQLKLGLTPEQILNLVTYLEDVYLNLGSELRVSINPEWVLFWKRRDEGSRTLVAHPQLNEWVGTIALDGEFGLHLLSSLKNLKPGQSLSLNQVGTLASVSNLELMISCEG